jgi:hypothetical protein
MQLKNTSAGRSAPLHGLQGLLAPPAPRTREELISFTGMSIVNAQTILLLTQNFILTVANCMAAANYLQLPALQNATVMVRRQQIASYLGISLD